MHYHRPRNLEEAVSLANAEAYFLAGGTDLVMQVRAGLVKPQALIDLSKVKELHHIGEADGYLHLGSMVSFNDLMESELVRTKARALWLACQSMGSPQIRNRATLGGNLANCSPAADSLPPLLALGAEVQLLDHAGEKLVPLVTLLNRKPLLAPGTLISCLRIPVRGWHSGFAKLGRRRALAIARLNIAIAVELSGTWAGNVRVALGAVSDRPFLSGSLGQLLHNREINLEWQEAALQGVQAAVRNSLGSRASAAYKKMAVTGLMRQTLESLG